MTRVLLSLSRFGFAALTVLAVTTQTSWAASSSLGVLITRRNQAQFEQFDSATHCYFKPGRAAAIPGKVVKAAIPGGKGKKGSYFRDYASIRAQEVRKIRESKKGLWKIPQIRYRYDTLIYNNTILCSLPPSITGATTNVLTNATAPEQSLVNLMSLIHRGMSLSDDPAGFFLKVEEAMLKAFQTKADFDALGTVLSALEDFYSVPDLIELSQSTAITPRVSGCESVQDVILYQVSGGQDFLLRAIASGVLLNKLSTAAIEYRVWTNRGLYTTTTSEQICRQFAGPASLPYLDPNENQRISNLPLSHRAVAKAYQSAYNRCLTVNGIETSQVQSYSSWLTEAQSFTPSSTDAQNLAGLVSQDVVSGRQVIVLAQGLGAKVAQSALALVPLDDDGDQKQSVGVIGLAPPSAFNNSSSFGSYAYYTLSDDQILGVSGAPVANIENPLSESGTFDPTLYRNAVADFAQSYLYFPTTRAALLASLSAQSSSLTNARVGAGQGYFQVTLSWNVAGDIDLHVNEDVANGKYVYYGSKLGTVGQLDRDDIPGTGPENYYVCNRTQMLNGSYTVWVNNFANSTTGVVSDITIRGHRTVKTFSVTMDSSNGKTRCLPVAVVTYTNGQFTIEDTRAQSWVACGP